MQENNIIDLQLDKLEKHKSNRKEELNEQNNNSNINILNLNKINSKVHITEKTLNKIDNKEYKLKKHSLFFKEDHPKTALNQKELLSSSFKHNEPLSFYENYQYEKSQTKYNTHKMKYIFPYYYFFLDFIFDKFLHPEKFLCIPKAYFIVYNYMCQIYDISSHIILFKQFNALKKYIEEKKYESDSEISSIRKFQKINISQTKSIEKLGEDLKQRKSVLFSDDLL